ncbi:MAG TPA: hypothetical protein PLZ36_00025 [Armatimonadota bacterium]|nr:hypothetical protein [Armatimonadota bacterium]
MAHATKTPRKDAAPQPARGKKRPVLKSPWQRNRVRRRWTYLLGGVVFLAAAALIFGNLDLDRDAARRLPLTLFGFAALPLLYPLARRLGVSRGTAIWALALLAASVPWLVLLRACTTCAVMPFFVVLGALCYTRVLAGLPGAWCALGLALVTLSLANPWAGLGLALGLALHAAGWVRGRARWRALGGAGAILAVGFTVLALYPPARDPAWGLPGGAGIGQFLGYLLLLNAWVLPLPALPLLGLALFTDPAHRWRVNGEAALPALIITATLLAAGLSPGPIRLRILLGVAPLAALWLAMGLARLQARAPAWVWAPVGVLLVLTALPHLLVRWGSAAIGLHRIIPDRAVSEQLADSPADQLVPLYPLLRDDLTGDRLERREI